MKKDNPRRRKADRRWAKRFMKIFYKELLRNNALYRPTPLLNTLLKMKN